MPLNVDIYLMVMDHLESRSDISALMRSCKTLFAEGAKLLLLPGVSIRSDAHLVSFCRFILRDTAVRAPCLRRLFLCIELQLLDEDGTGSVWECKDIDKELLKGSKLLRRVLRRASALEHLTIHFCEELLERDESLIGALVALETVQYLHITSFGLCAHEVVVNIRSPLVEVKVDCHTGAGSDLDVSQILARHRVTLQRVTAWEANLTRSFLPLPERTPVVFPRVRSLALIFPVGLDLTFLANAFPNVRSLVVSQISTGFCVVDEDLRDANRAALSSWRSLDRLCGDHIALWILALQCSVRRIEIDWDDMGWEWIRDIVSDAAASHLLLRGFVGRYVSPCQTMWEVPEEWRGNNTVTHLGLELCPDELFLGTSHGVWPDLLYLICAFDLTFFALRLHPLPLQEESPYAPDDHRYPKTAILGQGAESILDGLRLCAPALPAWVHMLAEAVPSLQYVSLDVLGDTPNCWRILRPEDGRIVVAPLEAEEGEAIIRAEGMEWSRRDPEPPQFDRTKVVHWDRPYEEDEWAWDPDSDGDQLLE